MTTFHTLAHTKAAAGVDDDPIDRAHVEAEVVACSDRVVASTLEERAELVADYGADPERIEVIPPGVDHATFWPGDRDAARARLGLPERSGAAVRRPDPAAEGRRPRGPMSRRAPR